MQTKQLLELSKYFLETKNIKKEEINKLQEIINIHSDLYHNKENPIISDFEYDLLFKKLSLLEEKFDIKNKESKNVWSLVKESSFEKVKHSRPMISLDNTYNEEDLFDFDKRIKWNLWFKDEIYWKKNFFHLQIFEQWWEEYILEFKFDWLWVELIYKSWDLIQAITRGNWIEWEDITENILQLENIPKKIKYTDDLEVRWEVVMPISSFKELNKKREKSWENLFSNPRNAASWSLRTLDINITKERKLKFFAYDLANFEEFRIKEKKDKYFDVIKDLEELWFEISSYFKACNWVSELIKEIDNFWNVKKQIDFEIDWLVIKVNDISLWSIIWSTEHHPRYAIAYKFPAELITTKVLSIEHSVGRTWTITPVANLEAVNIWWVVVKRASLHNYDEIKNKDVKIWDQVFVKRAWEVIPEIVSVIKEARNWEEKDIETPTNCPVCDSQIKKDQDKVRYYCPNKNFCPAQIKEKLAYSVWKTWFNIDWLWEKQVELFLKEWLIKNLVDIFRLKEKKDDILKLEWFKEKSVYNLIESIENARRLEINVFLTAIWISWVWKKASKNISFLFKSKDDLINFSHTKEELENIKDIWPEIAKNIFDYFNDTENKKQLNDLTKELEIKYFIEEKNKYNSFLSWKKVCITWSFENHKREDLIKIIEEKWAEFVSSISKNTDFLLAWEKAWSKLKKAIELWVKIIWVEEIL